MNQADYLLTLKGEIDEALDRFTLFSDAVPPRLREAIRYSLLLPGKRLRPTLVLLAAEAAGGSRSRAIPAACAVEMVHDYSLIHDDLPAMDNDDLRRGKPTSHKQFDEATAILAGDALLTFAFETILKTPDPILRGDLAAALAEAAGPAGMVGGQTDDVLYEKRLPGGTVTADSLLLLNAIHRRKAGAMIGVSLRLGAMVAGADPEKRNALETYGCSLGMAFQITDDLLDVTGDEKSMGKRLQKDADKGKLTFPSVLGLEESQKAAEREIQTAKEALKVFPDGTLAKEALLGQADHLLTRRS